MLAGTILKGIGGFYYVKSADTVYECKARGIFRKENLTPLPGDRVHMEILDVEDRKGNITEILPRSSSLVRPAVANIDQLAAVVALKSPEPDLLLLDKLLLTAGLKGIPALICINKIDLGPAEDLTIIETAYKKAGYPIVCLSSVNGTGFDSLAQRLEKRVTVFAGQSGVGKSTILNVIMDSIVMVTGEVSSRIKRGRHTTRHAELVELSSGGFIVDTPGFSSLELTDMADVRLEQYYPEFAQYIDKCRFKGCSHVLEPGCLVREAVEADKIDKGRYDRYIHFYSLLKDMWDNRYKSRKPNNRGLKQ